MQVRQFKDILTIQATNGKFVGFHARNLEVAELSKEAWSASNLNSLSIDFANEALQSLEDWNQVTNPDSKLEISSSKVKSLSINVTQICNLKCVYCAAGGDGTYGDPQKKISVEKTLPQIKVMMNRLSAGDSFNITFLGGEPMLYPDGIELIGSYAMDLAKNLDVKINFNIITNGTLINSENIKALTKLKTNITLSLDGNPKDNDRVRPAKNKSSSTLAAIEGVKIIFENRMELGAIGVQGVYGTFNTELVNAYRFFSEFDFDWMDFHFDQKSSDKEASNKFKTELAKVADLAFNNGGEKALRKLKFFDAIFDQLDRRFRIQNFCASGKGYVVLDSKNNAFICPWEVGDIKKSVGSGTDISPEAAQTLKTPTIEKNNCGTCWARHLCGGGCMWAHEKSTGDKHKVDEVYCDRTRHLISLGILYYYQARGH